MSVLVVGGAGYIGSVVVERLVERGEKVVVVDNLSRGHRDAVHPACTFIHGDMADTDLISEALTKHQCDVVMHFSALSLVSESMKHPLLYYENNVGRGIKLVQAMLQSGVERVIFSSTAAIYGIPVHLPIKETDPAAPINPYGRTKHQFEQFLFDCAQSQGLSCISLRYFNAAGASERFGEDHRPETHLIPNVLQVPLKKRDSITVFGNDYNTPDGTCIRDYIHVVDLADAHLSALDYVRKSNPATTHIFNLGNNRGFSVMEIIKVAEQVTGSSIKVSIGPRREGDSDVLVASSEKIRKELGWQPSYPDIHQIIESAWRWHSLHPHGYAQ